MASAWYWRRNIRVTRLLCIILSSFHVIICGHMWAGKIFWLLVFPCITTSQITLGRQPHSYNHLYPHLDSNSGRFCRNSLQATLGYKRDSSPNILPLKYEYKHSCEWLYSSSKSRELYLPIFIAGVWKLECWLVRHTCGGVKPTLMTLFYNWQRNFHGSASAIFLFIHKNYPVVLIKWR